MSSPLPKLPVPPLDQTLHKYLKYLRPFLTPKEFSETAIITQEFLSKEGAYLQQLLQERAASTDNWLSEWWLESAYLRSRGPLPIYSTPVSMRRKHDFPTLSHLLDYVSSYLYGTGLFFESVRTGSLLQERVGDTPLCMHQYYSLPGTYRVPGAETDYLRLSPNSNHILVIHRGRYFKLPIYTCSGETKRVLLPQQIKFLLSSIVTMSDEPQVPVGVLTTLDRHTWSVVREEMMTSPVNRHSLDVIEQSLLAVMLDEAGAKSYESFFLQTMVGDIAQDFRYFNRWHDIRYQKVITRDGYSSAAMEHTATDGPPAMTQAQAAYTAQAAYSVQNTPVGVSLPPLEELTWDISPSVAGYIKDAKYRLTQLSKQLDVKVFSFSEFGKSLPKTRRISPDSCIQLAIQLTFYRLHGKPAACYESCSTRQFYKGRTDTIRPTSPESTDLVEAMCSDAAVAAKLSLLKRFNEEHKRYSIDAWNGQAIDRHLFGLQFLAKQQGISPRFFSDTGYTRSTHMRISSSQLPNSYYEYVGYAPLVEDGYGVCYNPQAFVIHFVVSSFNSCPDTVTADRFGEVMTQSLRSVKLLLEQYPIPSSL